MKDTLDRVAPRPGPTGPARSWPLLDTEFDRRTAPVLDAPDGRLVQKDLDRAYLFTAERPVPYGRPLAVEAGRREGLARFVAAYHRAMETVVGAYPTDHRLQAVLSMPPALRADLRARPHPADSRVHFMRVDALPQPDGSLRVLETNANCPGALVVAGLAARRWRHHLTTLGERLPEPLDGEDPLWMGRWFLRVAHEETGETPTTVALLRHEGGNRLELDLIRAAFEELGVRTVEADPREVRTAPEGAVVRGVPLRHAYLKVGLQEFCAMRGDAGDFVQAVRAGDLFVQNRQLGRWVGDNKLCLAVLSDPSFHDLFDKADLALLTPAVPWSRNVARLTSDRVTTIRRAPADYVLKKPLDTRGRGVVVGREAPDPAAWNSAVDRALREGWLVQEYCATPEIETGSGGRRGHDLALAAVNGVLSAAFLRSSEEARVNIARSGRLHPLYL
ncbi:hypothetical protein [Streptomyces collinus]|uniref:hypothetical protein n=1 Tax=Streptomyces collinus TaxID=42684 RepID=UPI003627C33F